MVTKENLLLGTGASSCTDDADLLRVVRAAAESGILSFDTAPGYHTQAVLGRVLRQLIAETGIPRPELFIQTKIDPFQMQKSGGAVQPYAEAALKEIGVTYLDALLIHWPLPEYLESTWQSLVQMQAQGMVRQIGISNVRMRQLRQMVRWDVPPQIIQIERNPLRTCTTEIDFCRQHGILVQAYSPLCKMDVRIRDDADLLALAEKYHKSVGQVVLRWHLDSGVMPIFTSTKPARVQEYAALDDFCLTDEEIATVTAKNIDYKMYLESWKCPGF